MIRRLASHLLLAAVLIASYDVAVQGFTLPLHHIATDLAGLGH